MPLYIKDAHTAELVAQLAERLRTTKQNAVKSAVAAELRRLGPRQFLDAKLQALRSRHPPLVPSGELADKAFFDELSAEVD